MTSIVRRATPSQKRIMRAVSGAVKNALDAHPGCVVPKWLANSVAKRAAGTLTAGWPEVLAARDSVSSDSVPGVAAQRWGPRGFRGLVTKPRRVEVSSCKGHLPRAKLVGALTRPLRRLKETDPLRAEVYIEVLRLIDKLDKE